MYKCGCTCAHAYIVHVCWSPGWPEEAIRTLGPGVTGGSDLTPGWVLTPELESSRNAILALNCRATSPSPDVFSIILASWQEHSHYLIHRDVLTSLSLSRLWSIWSGRKETMRKPWDSRATRMTTTAGLGNFTLGTILETDKLKAFLTESLGQLVNCGRFPVFIMLLELINE